MNILMISGDGKILQEGSVVYERMRMQAYILGKLVVFVRGKPARVMLGMDREESYVEGFGGSKPLAFLKMFSAAQRDDFDVVTAQDPFYLGFLGWLIARGKGVPLELQVHTDLFSPEFIRGNGSLKVTLAKFLLRRADHVRVVSRRIKDDILSLRLRSSEAVSVVPVFIDLAKVGHVEVYEFHQHPVSFSKSILVAARLHRERCVGDAIALIAKLPEDVALFIAGQGAERPKLEALACSLGVENRVVFLGHVVDMFPLYKGADLYLNTSRYDGYGASIVEALAMGCPVLSEDVGVAAEAGAVVAPREEWAETILPMLENGERVSLQMHVLGKEEYGEALRQSFSFVQQH